ncbi:MAG: rod shape-determining protein MreD [Clostridia bacterium]|nr:rod shape-determining protein MreD [Clostridia bacterium]
MRYVVLAFLGLIGLVLETTLFNELIVAGVKPDLILIIVILYALFNGPRQGAFVGLTLGFLEDLFQAKYFGLNAATKFITGLLAGFLEKRMYKDNFFVPVLVLFTGSLVHTLLYFLFSNLVGYQIETEKLWRVILPFAVYNTCFCPFIYSSFYKSSTKGILKRNTSV